MLYTLMMSACQGHRQATGKESADTFQWKVDQFADLKILRYQVPGFDSLTLQQKELLYYLGQAALCGRDIIYDQNGKYNLAIRKTLESIVENYTGDRSTEDFQKFIVYTKRVWFSNGIYHHYSNDKFIPGFSKEYFISLVNTLDDSKLPLAKGQDRKQFLSVILPVMFDPTVLPKKVNQTAGDDLVKKSAVNFYDGISENEVTNFYRGMKKPGDTEPLSYGLNSKLVKENGKIREITWKVGGMYNDALKQIVYWLEKAKTVAEDPGQAGIIDKLISYYQTGNLKAFDEYNIQWVRDTVPLTDFVNGFIEVYNDPLGLKATWESVVDFKNLEATRRTEIISNNAQWFEDHSPVDSRFKKEKVKGVSAKVITVSMLGGDCSPSTPIGINLPNADWIRKEYGSKSVTMENITYAYDQAAKGNGFLEEFCASKEEIDLIQKYGFIADNLHTDLHECLGHGSGQLLPGVSVEALKNYHSTLEEARADLFALYYMMDPEMIKLGLLPTLDAAKAEYMSYIRNGLFTQLTRIEPGKNIEEAHMRNRALIAQWCFEQGKKDNVIEQFKRDGKTYFRINDFQKLRTLFGELLKEVQRIKSEGDYAAGKVLVEQYGVKVDQTLHNEVLKRYKKLNLAPYSGFINPEYSLVEKDGKIVDVKVSYPTDFVKQMLDYSKRYSFLPTWN